MVERIHKWLKSKRDFYDGTELYAALNEDAAFVNQLRKGRTEKMHQLLTKRLTETYNKLTALSTVAPHFTDKSARITPENENITKKIATEQPKTENSAVRDETLAELKAKADLKYKDVMNARAVLFSLAKSEPGKNINAEENIEARRKLAIDVVTGWQEVSNLYDDYRYAQEHHALPVPQSETDTADATAIPDGMVKHRLDILKVYLRRAVKQDPTPARLDKIELYKKQIAVLEDRWQRIKPER